jgi:hypothetical protein
LEIFANIGITIRKIGISDTGAWFEIAVPGGA